MLLGYLIDNLDPYLIHLYGSIGIRWYGLAYVAGFAAAYYLMKAFAREGLGPLKEKEVGDFIFLAAVFGVLLGGRLGYVLFYKPELFLDPLKLPAVWDGGMASHGGILGLIIFSYVYARRKKISWTALGDNLVTVAPVGLFFGRIANFINGELFGRATTVPWAMQFPSELLDNPDLAGAALDKAAAAEPALRQALNGPDAVHLLIDHARTSHSFAQILGEILTPRHPSQLYEAALEGFALFGCLYFIRRRFRDRPGFTTGCFFVLYASFRILVENFREPDIGVALTGSLTRGQFLSLFMWLIGAAFIWKAMATSAGTAAGPQS